MSWLNGDQLSEGRGKGGIEASINIISHLFNNVNTMFNYINTTFNYINVVAGSKWLVIR